MIILVVGFCSLVFAQNESYDMEDIAREFGYQVSDAVNTTFGGDSLTITGVDTVWIFVHSKRSLGDIYFKGTVRSVTDSDSVHIELANHSGDGQTLDSNIPETYYSFKILAVDSGATNGFHFFLQDTVAFRTKKSNYYTLKIYNTTTYTAIMKMDIDFINHYAR